MCNRVMACAFGGISRPRIHHYLLAHLSFNRVIVVADTNTVHVCTTDVFFDVPTSSVGEHRMVWLLDVIASSNGDSDTL